ncbi:hypothetical protein [Glutamicibacter sp. X7]
MNRIHQAVAKLMRWVQSRIHDDQGSSLVEFIFISTVLMIPMVYAVLTAGAVQAASYAVTGAADHAAKAFVGATTPAEGQARAHGAADRTMENFGLSGHEVSISCEPGCLQPGSTATIHVEIAVPLPFLEGFSNVSIAYVDSTSTQRVDLYG